MLGHLGHPSDGKTSLENASHVITGLKIKDGIVIGEAEILRTPAGKILKDLIEDGIQIGVSSRGYGSTAPSRGAHEGEEVQDDFVLRTYDFVADPAVRSAIPNVYSEDVDGKSLVEMILNEFPDEARELRGTVSEDEILEEGADGKKNTNKELVDSIRNELSENFERKLKDTLLDMRDDIRSEVQETLESDPEVAGAKGVLEAIADMVAVYRGDSDVDAVKDAVKASELEVSEAKRERDEAVILAKEVAHQLHIEKKVSDNPMKASIRKLMKGRKFENLKEVDEALDAIISDLPESDSFVGKEDVKIREENAELRGKITLLESKVEELSGNLRKAGMLGERIDEQRIKEVGEANEKIEELERELEEMREDVSTAKSDAKAVRDEAKKLVEDAELEVYKRDKVVGYTNGRELIGLMENIHDRDVVDDVVGKNGLTGMRDPELQRMRESLFKGKTSKTMQLDESSQKPKIVKKDEFGNDMAEMVKLAGIS